MKCKYHLSEDCNSKDCIICILDKIRNKIKYLHYHPKLDFINNGKVVEMVLDIIDIYKMKVRNKEMTNYQKYINALRQCAKEHKNDTTFTGHIIVADLCRDTANLLEELEQESSKNMEEIEEVINCDADAETKCKMISNILTAKPHYFNESQESE